jgi:uncharacterized protein YerC
MTQVSRFPLSKALEDEMHGLFRRVISELNNEKDVADFLDDILSPTEKIMLGKRLAIALLIQKGYDHRTIQSILHVSLTTVSSVHFWLKNRGTGYRKVIERIVASEKWNDQLEKLNSVIKEFSTLGSNSRLQYPFLKDKNNTSQHTL